MTTKTKINTNELRALAEDFRNQTFDQYCSNENILKLNDLMERHYLRELSTIWFSSKMADTSITALALDLLAFKLDHI